MSLHKNFFYNSILTVSNYIFPLITYPYVSRVLGVTNIGICNFVDSFVNYFVLFSMMGMATIGIREIAGAGTDIDKRNKIFSSLFFLNGITTLIALVTYIACIFLIPELNKYINLLYIGIIKLIANFFLINWLFAGLEDFKYITIRSILVHSLYVLAVFLFVKTQTDYSIYYLLLTLSIVVNAFINCIYSRRYVRLFIRNIYIKPFLKPTLILGLRSFLTSMYTTFNVVFLGMVTTDTEVGYYTTATKLYAIIIALFSAFTSVMLPRMSSLIADDRINEFKNKINQSIELLLLMSIPLIIYSIIYAPEIILFVSGSGYEGAITPMRLVMPLVLIIGIEQIFIIQTLVPLKADKALLINTLFGACIGVIMNFVLVYQYKSIGSSIVWILSELAVLSSAIYFVKKKANINLAYKKILIYIVYYIPCIFILYILSNYNFNFLLKLLIAAILTLIYALVLNVIILKNKLAINSFKMLIKRFENAK